MARPYLFFGTKARAPQTYSTQYLKEQCIFPVSTPTTPLGKICLAGAVGVHTPYTIGYTCLALNYKNGAGERNMSRDILDIYAQQGAIQTIILANFGADYTAGDILLVNAFDDDGTGLSTLQIQINTVNANGSILTWTQLNSPTGYPPAQICSTTGGTGSGAQFQVITDLMQHSKGWWFDSYNPYMNPPGYTFNRITVDPIGRSGDLRVDSDASLLVWAMADYDDLTGGSRYLTPVRKAIAWLRSLQAAHFGAHGSNLISNLVYQNSIDTTALIADSAETLLCLTRAMDAYGVGLLDSNGYSVQIMANDLYTSLTTAQPAGAWGGADYSLYLTSFPPGQNDAPPFSFNYVEPITYTQSLTAWANYTFANSPYITVTDNSYQAELALDYTWSRMAGQFGGQLYTPFDPNNLTQTDTIEHLAYTAEMCIAMAAVNPTKYANHINALKAAMKKNARSTGMAWGQTHDDGSLWRALISGVNVTPKVEAYGFVVLDVSFALLAGV